MHKPMYDKSSSEALNSLLKGINCHPHYTSNRGLISEYPLSHTQYQIWLHQQLNPESFAFNNYDVWSVHGTLQPASFRALINEIALNQRILHTVFLNKSGVPVQKVLENSQVEYNHYLIEAASEDLLAKSVLKQIQYPFDVSTKPPIRVTTLSLSEKEYVLIIVMHHIISDARTMSIFRNELLNRYCGVSECKAFSPTYESVDFLDVVGNDYNPIKATSGLMHQSTNEERQSREISKVINLPYVKSHHSSTGPEKGNGKKYLFDISTDTANNFIASCKELGITPFAGYLSAYEILLSYYSDLQSVPIGIPISSRKSMQLRNMLGPLTSVKCFHFPLSANMSYSEFANKVSSSVYENSLKGSLEMPSYDPRENAKPQFKVAFVYQNEPATEPTSCVIAANRYFIHNRSAKYDLTIIIYPQREQNKIEIEYDEAIYQQETAEVLAAGFERILQIVSDNPQIFVGEIDLVRDSERKRILHDFNATYADYPRSKTIPEIFKEKMLQNPSKFALCEGSNSLTYYELWLRANSISNYIQINIGNEKDLLIGTYLERSIDAIVAMLGILCAGAGYVPIDVNIPIQRASAIFKEAGVRAIITNCKIAEESGIEKFGISIICLEKLHLNPTFLPPILGSSQNIAYVMYTSGSTGAPKGVVIRQYSISRLVLNTNYLKILPDDRFLQVNSHGFDASTFEIWGALLNGATLYMISSQVDTEKIAKIISRESITTILLTTGLFNALVDCDICDFNSVRNLLIGGEKLSPKHVNKIRQMNLNMRIFNVYGPTESTTFASTFEIAKQYDGDIPIGTPISNTTILIINNNRLCGIGHSGEICIGGDGLAREYLNDVELTTKKFIPHPYYDGERLYRSGDVGRWLPDGTIEYIGRIDRQVKIRGYRIELDEVELALNAIEGVDEAVVELIPMKNGEKRLCAYYVSKSSLQQAVVMDSLRRILPDYMLPSDIIMLPKMPLTHNGKINRKSLPIPYEPDNNATVSIDPIDEVENKLLTIWQETLKRIGIGVLDNFFEIGGHSLIAMIIVSRIKKELSIDFSLREFFDYPTIRKLSERIRIIKSIAINQGITNSDSNDEGKI